MNVALNIVLKILYLQFAISLQVLHHNQPVFKGISIKQRQNIPYSKVAVSVFITLY